MRAGGQCPGPVPGGRAGGGHPQGLEGDRRGKDSALPRGFDGGGVLRPPKDPEALAQALIGLLKDEELRRGIGSRARQRILEEYDIKNTAERLVEFYGSICKKEGR